MKVIKMVSKQILKVIGFHYTTDIKKISIQNSDAYLRTNLKQDKNCIKVYFMV